MNPVRPWQAAKPCNCPTDRELSPAEQARIDAIEAAEDAPESLRFRVAKALHDAEPRGWLHLADAALAVILTPATQGHPDDPRDASTAATEGWRAPATSTLTGQDQS